MFEATKEDVKSWLNVETVSVGKGFTISEKGMPLMLEMKAPPVETVREERKGGIERVGGFRIVVIGTSLMLEMNACPVESEKEDRKGGTGGFTKVENEIPLMLEINAFPVEI
tara:strand:+ start:2805 stop:3140 length:336 start_codon:yes stop_codon:yes gene_type:complete